MQLTYLDAQQLADLIDEGKVLKKIEGPGAGTTLVLNWDNEDFLAVTDTVTGAAVVIGPDDAFDEGSIHDQARRGR